MNGWSGSPWTQPTSSATGVAGATGGGATSLANGGGGAGCWANGRCTAGCGRERGGCAGCAATAGCRGSQRQSRSHEGFRFDPSINFEETNASYSTYALLMF